MPIPQHKLNALAHMAVAGNGAEEMAQVTDLKVDTIKRLLSRGNPKFNALKEAHGRKLLASEVLHVMRMRDEQEQCYDNIHTALRGTDKRLAMETTWKVLDTVVPKRAVEQSPIDVNVNVRAEAEFKQVVLDMGKEFIEIKEFLATQDPNKHVKTGAEALPRAIEATVVPVVKDEKTAPEDDNSRW